MTAHAVGDRATLTVNLTPEIVASYIAATGDDNPVHHDAAYAATTRFGRPIGHGMWCGGIISALLGTKLPGPGSIYLSQSLTFVRPAYVGTNVVASVEVLAVRTGKPILTLRTECRDEEGHILAEGEAVVLAPS